MASAIVAITADDPRSIKALAIAQGASQWLHGTLKATGRKVYGIPSQSNPAVLYWTNLDGCSCPDFQRSQLPCKHVYATRIVCEQKKAERLAAEKAQKAQAQRQARRAAKAAPAPSAEQADRAGLVALYARIHAADEVAA